EIIRPFDDITANLLSNLRATMEITADQIFLWEILCGYKRKKGEPDYLRRLRSLVPEDWEIIEEPIRKRYFTPEDFETEENTGQAQQEAFERWIRNEWFQKQRIIPRHKFPLTDSFILTEEQRKDVLEKEPHDVHIRFDFALTANQRKQIETLDAELKRAAGTDGIVRFASPFTLNHQQKKQITELNILCWNIEDYIDRLSRGADTLRARIESGLFPLPYDFYKFKLHEVSLGIFPFTKKSIDILPRGSQTQGSGNRKKQAPRLINKEASPQFISKYYQNTYIDELKENEWRWSNRLEVLAEALFQINGTEGIQYDSPSDLVRLACEKIKYHASSRTGKLNGDALIRKTQEIWKDHRDSKLSNEWGELQNDPEFQTAKVLLAKILSPSKSGQTL
ncbi:MAG TPA: hypothetical protein VFA55_06200, partial [Candidatus Kapabacteria bacterium]|nr:hypothetical protein [Candidatus Kapabacteria bacterium]